MSGHSKWATIKRKKAATDQARGKLFSKLIKEVTIAARQGGGDLEANARLRTAVAAAKAGNMPAANIDRAIKRGTGEIDGVNYEETQYEGYAPGGVAVLVEVATDNKNRTAGEVRHLFTKHGGNLGDAGSVAYMFKAQGLILVDKSAIAEDALIELVLEAGAEDVDTSGDTYEIVTGVSEFEAVKAALASKNVETQSAELTKISSITVDVDEKHATSILKLIDLLEDHDDVQKVYANFNMSEEVMTKLSK